MRHYPVLGRNVPRHEMGLAKEALRTVSRVDLFGHCSRSLLDPSQTQQILREDGP